MVFFLRISLGLWFAGENHRGEILFPSHRTTRLVRWLGHLLQVQVTFCNFSIAEFLSLPCQHGALWEAVTFWAQGVWRPPLSGVSNRLLEILVYSRFVSWTHLLIYLFDYYIVWPCACLSYDLGYYPGLSYLLVICFWTILLEKTVVLCMCVCECVYTCTYLLEMGIRTLARTLPLSYIPSPCC